VAELEENLINTANLTREQARDVTMSIFDKIITPDIEEVLRTFLKKELEQENSEVDTQKTEELNVSQEKPKEVPTKNSSEEIKKLLRENSKTVNVKNIISNLKI